MAGGAREPRGPLNPSVQRPASAASTGLETRDAIGSRSRGRAASAPDEKVRQMMQSRWLWIGGQAVVPWSSTCEDRVSDSAAACASMIDPPPQRRAWSPSSTIARARGTRYPEERLGKWRMDMGLVYPRGNVAVQTMTGVPGRN